jgi:hypothetical protein
MKSPFYFIVKPLNGRRYDNVVSFGDKEMIISNNFEDHKTTNRFAEVLELPNNYKGNIDVGDILIVHHNVFRIQLDMKGREVSGRSFLRNDTFFVDDSQYFAYKKKGKWYSHDEYCFVEPVDYDQDLIYTSLKEQPLTGRIYLSNDSLNNLGVLKGDKVLFEPDSEYKFSIDGNTVYRMYTRNIVAKL